MTDSYELQDMDCNEMASTLAPDDAEALAIFGKVIGGRLDPCDGPEASHRIVRTGHKQNAIRQGMRPEISNDEPVVIFAKRTA